MFRLKIRFKPGILGAKSMNINHDADKVRAAAICALIETANVAKENIEASAKTALHRDVIWHNATVQITTSDPRWMGPDQEELVKGFARLLAGKVPALGQGNMSIWVAQEAHFLSE